MNPFIIENIGNTCYIDSLLMGLFYDPSKLDNLLNKNITNTLGIYVQEYIKENFVNLVRNNKSVLRSNIEMIKTLCFQLGWKQYNEYTEQQDINEFYTFLMEILENEQIEIRRNNISENSNNKIETIPFIPLSLSPISENIKVSELLHNWLINNTASIKNNDIITKSPNSYYINNIPYLIALSINRFNNCGQKIETPVIIQKRISTNNQDIIHNTKWEFHAAICHKGVTSKSGHYYVLLVSKNIWYIFDDLLVPCMREVKMDDITVTEMLKKECIFLLYKLPKSC